LRNDIANAHILSKISGITVQVYNGTSWINLVNPAGSAFPGKSRVKSLQWGYTDSGRWTATVTFLNTPEYREASESLDPLDASIFNPAGVPLLGCYHKFQIKIGKYSALGVAGAQAMVFSGRVGPDSIEPEEGIEGKDYVVTRVVGVMQRYFADYIDKTDRGRKYTDCYVSGIWNATTAFAVGDVVTLDTIAYQCILANTNQTPPNPTYWTVFSGTNNVMNRILLDYGYAADVVIAPSPTGQDTLTYYCPEYEIGDISVGDAILNPISAIGFVLMEKYNVVAADFVPTVVDPDRDNVTPNLDMAGDINVVRLNYSEANVRTFVRVLYYNDADGSWKYADAENLAALALYGLPGAGEVKLHKRMRIVEIDSSWIDSQVEAQREANYAAQDAGTVQVAVSAVIPWLALDIEGGDIVRVTSPSKTMDIGVTSITHSIGEGDTLGSTVISGTLGRRVGNYGYWFKKSRTDGSWKHDRYLELLHGPTPAIPTNVVAKGVWGMDASGSAAPVIDISWFGANDGRTRTHVLRYRALSFRELGTATAGTTTSLSDTAKTWTVNQYRNGGYCYLTGLDSVGAALVSRLGTDNMRRVLSNAANQLVFSDALPAAPAVGEAYEIYWATGEWHEVTVGSEQFVQLAGLPEGSDYLIQIAAVPTVTGT
jgi:hypothetical protein